jgi:hypothetical protein
MDVEYELAAADDDALVQWTMSRPAVRAFPLILAALFGVVFAIATLTPCSTVVALIIGALVFCVSGLVLPRAFAYRLRSAAAKQRARLGRPDRIRVHVDEVGIEHESARGSMRRNWDAVHRVDATSRHLFIYPVPAMVITVPRRAFATDEAWAHFCDFVQQHASGAVRAGL